jgi:hypothetical protein
VAGDVTHSLTVLAQTLALTRKCLEALCVPGNHEPWVTRDRRSISSVEKFEHIHGVVADSGPSMQRFTADDVTVVPLLSWYDFSFGTPSPRLRELWMDSHAWRWPEFADKREVAAWFSTAGPPPANLIGCTVISLSHFLPRPELVPHGACSASTRRDERPKRPEWMNFLEIWSISKGASAGEVPGAMARVLEARRVTALRAGGTRLR